jgi:Fe-S cluster biogenesis protein NfuA
MSDFVRPPAEFSLAQVKPVVELLAEYDDLAKIQGVYAIQDDGGNVQYVGSSTTVASDVRRHLSKHGASVVSSIRIQTFANPNTEAIDAYKLELIRQTSAKGNLEDATQWEDKAVIRSSDPAVGVSSKESAGASTSSSGKVIERLIEIVDADEDRKTAATAAARSGVAIESPFASTGVNQQPDDRIQSDGGDSYIIGPIASTGLDLTKENVDKVLEEIRPYLIADGGNVAVVAIDDFTRSISLSLQGACGSCPSSTVSN